MDVLPQIRLWFHDRIISAVESSFSEQTRPAKSDLLALCYVMTFVFDFETDSDTSAGPPMNANSISSCSQGTHSIEAPANGSLMYAYPARAYDIAGHWERSDAS